MTRRLKTFAAVLVTTCVLFLILGSFSIRPFTRLWLPWMMFAQWKRAAFPAAPDEACMAAIKAGGVSFETGMGGMPARYQDYGCVVETPLIVQQIVLPFVNNGYQAEQGFAILSCKFAQRLQVFIRETIVPEAQRSLGKKPTAFLHKGGYSCRGQQDFTAIKSEHSFAQAIDFSGLRFEDGSEILVEKDFSDPGITGQFLRTIAARACEELGTTLGPAFDDHHRDHLHWSIGFPKACIF